MAMAPVTYCLWQQFLRFDPTDPVWPNRDRFVLSIRHAAMLHYSRLHLTGVRAVSKDYETLGELSVSLDAPPFERLCRELRAIGCLENVCHHLGRTEWTANPRMCCSRKSTIATTIIMLYVTIQVFQFVRLGTRSSSLQLCCDRVFSR